MYAVSVFYLLNFHISPLTSNRQTWGKISDKKGQCHGQGLKEMKRVLLTYPPIISHCT